MLAILWQFLVPLLILLFGVLLTAFPPKQPNMLGIIRWGIRVPSGYASQEKWEYAQKIGARYMIIAGFVSLVPALILYVLHTEATTVVRVAALVGAGTMLVALVVTEIQTRRL